MAMAGNVEVIFDEFNIVKHGNIENYSAKWGTS